MTIEEKVRSIVYKAITNFLSGNDEAADQATQAILALMKPMSREELFQIVNHSDLFHLAKTYCETKASNDKDFPYGKSHEAQNNLINTILAEWGGGGQKMNREKESENPQFSLTDRGYSVKAWYLKDTNTEKGDALIEINKEDTLLRQFIFPAYKIWNIAAHFSDIVDSEIEKNIVGYKIAASDGLGGSVGIAFRNKEAL